MESRSYRGASAREGGAELLESARAVGHHPCLEAVDLRTLGYARGRHDAEEEEAKELRG
jgi:hypothetical protein